MRIKSPKDFWAGLMFIAFGLAFGIIAQNYQMGSAVRMGPAYFPTVLGGILAVLGIAVVIQSFALGGPKVPRFHFRPLLFLLLGIVLFGILLKPLGLALASALVVVIGAFGGFEFRWKEVAILYVVLAAFSVYVFVKGLGLPIPIWPGE